MLLRKIELQINKWLDNSDKALLINGVSSSWKNIYN